MPLLREEKLGESHGIDVLAVLIYSHIARCDLVDEDDLAVCIVAVFKLDIVKNESALSEIVSDDLGDLASHVSHIVVLLVGHNAENNEAFLGYERVALSFEAIMLSWSRAAS